MKDLFSSIYLVSRIASAVLNLVAIAVFTRLSSEEVYGQYLIGFAYGFIVYGLAVQWLLAAHFGQQSRRHATRIANAVIVMVSISVSIGVAGTLLAASFGLLSPPIAFGCIAVLVGLAVYFVANELGRSQLRVVPVTIAAFLRSGLTLIFGAIALATFHTATSLLLAISLAHIAAGLPIVIDLRKSIWGEGFNWPVRDDYLQIWTYGWPLILAGGAAAVAASVDRLVLEHFFGAARVASYGVTLDFIKQSFIIVGESVAISYVSVAKAHHGDGADAEARISLKQAFATLALLAAFGVVFFLLLGGPMFGVLLGKNYLDAVSMVPWLALANACLILRSYYFAQVIYFAKSVRLELMSTLVALAASFGFSLLLIPIYDVAGAAIAYTVAQTLALLSVMVAPSTRQYMPTDLPRLGIILLAAGGVLIIGYICTLTLPMAVAAAVNVCLMSLVAAVLLVRWDMFDAGAIWQKLSGDRRRAAG